MTEIERSLGTPQVETSEFSWDALPDVAKERWEQMVAYSTTIENQLDKAKSSRAQAEVERQRIAKEILSATKEACQEVIANSRKTLEKIKSQTEEAGLKLEDAKRQLAEAETIRSEADAYREAVLARANLQAEEVAQLARSAADSECTKLKKRVSLEARHMLTQAEAMRAAAREELEAQRIYAEAAMLKADAHQTLDQLQAQLELPEPISNANGSGGEISNPWEQRAENGDRAAQAAPAEEIVKPASSINGAATVDNRKDASGDETAVSQDTPGPTAVEGEGSPEAGKSDAISSSRVRDRRMRAA